MSSKFKKIKVGQTPDDLQPEAKKKFLTANAKEVVRKKTRAQQRVIKRIAINGQE